MRPLAITYEHSAAPPTPAIRLLVFVVFLLALTLLLKPLQGPDTTIRPRLARVGQATKQATPATAPTRCILFFFK